MLIGCFQYNTYGKKCNSYVVLTGKIYCVHAGFLVW